MSMTKHERHLPHALEVPWGRDLFDTFLGERLRSLVAGESPFDRTFDGGSQLMRIEVFSEGDELVIRGELPGLDPEKDIQLSIEDDVLELRASREERSEEERPDGYRSEFRYGTLVRTLRLPEGVSGEDVRATYKDGILEVRVPNPPEAEPQPPRKIAVSRS